MISPDTARRERLYAALAPLRDALRAGESSGDPYVDASILFFHGERVDAYLRDVDERLKGKCEQFVMLQYAHTYHHRPILGIVAEETVLGKSDVGFLFSRSRGYDMGFSSRYKVPNSAIPKHCAIGDEEVWDQAWRDPEIAQFFLRSAREIGRPAEQIAEYTEKFEHAKKGIITQIRQMLHRRNEIFRLIELTKQKAMVAKDLCDELHLSYTQARILLDIASELEVENRVLTAARKAYNVM